MLNSCRLHWVPSTFSIMNICRGERWRQSIRQRFLGSSRVLSLANPQPVPPQRWRRRHRAQPPAWSPTTPGHPRILPALSCPFHVRLLLFFHRKGVMSSQFLRRCLCFCWRRKGARSGFPLLPQPPWKASGGQDRTSCPWHPFPASSQPPARLGSYWCHSSAPGSRSLAAQ